MGGAMDLVGSGKNKVIILTTHCDKVILKFLFDFV
jgi:acyl CoA:acetate/3-ketoacid CoA transferase beta subunit